MNTCSTCLWWEQHSQLSQYGDCKLTANYCGHAEHAQTKAVATNCFNYEDNVLVTEEDFGCNQWEEKEDEKLARDFRP